MNSETKRILILDDEANIRRTIKLCLEEEGYDTQMFSDSMQAYESLSHGEYDLAILDIRLPKINGVAVFKKMKEPPLEIENILPQNVSFYVQLHDVEKNFNDLTSMSIWRGMSNINYDAGLRPQTPISTVALRRGIACRRRPPSRFEFPTARRSSKPACRIPS